MPTFNVEVYKISPGVYPQAVALAVKEYGRRFNARPRVIHLPRRGPAVAELTAAGMLAGDMVTVDGVKLAVGRNPAGMAAVQVGI